MLTLWSKWLEKIGFWIWVRVVTLKIIMNWVTCEELDHTGNIDRVHFIPITPSAHDSSQTIVIGSELIIFVILTLQ